MGSFKWILGNWVNHTAIPVLDSRESDGLLLGKSI